MKNHKWDTSKIKHGFERFISEHHHYPTATEIDTCSYLPSSRQIQRVYGGLVKLRTELGLVSTLDYSKGKQSSQRARDIGMRAKVHKTKIYTILRDSFSEEQIQRDYFFTDDRRTKTDFFLSTKKGNFSIDIIAPKNRQSLVGCLNNKIKTYGGGIMMQYPLIFVLMNDSISEAEIEEMLFRKKNKLLRSQYLLTISEFKKFCRERE